MQIVKARPSDLVECMYILRSYEKDILSRGLLYLGHNLPLHKEVESEIDSGMVYICRNSLNISAGLIIFREQILPEHSSMAVSSQAGKSLVIHKIVLLPQARSEEVEPAILSFAETKARNEGFGSLRLDVFAGDSSALELYERHAFRQAGEYFRAFQKIPFKALEKAV